MPANTTIEESVVATINRLEEKDPGLKLLLKKAYAYAVFPSVGKAALVLGGAYGRGAVFERGKFIGNATISQVTVGVQIGGETFSEILVFRSKEALDRLKKGKMAFAANASAVLVKAGAMGTKDFANGVAAYAYSRSGLLLEAVIGEQKFTFVAAGKRKGRSAASGEDRNEGGKEKSGLLGRVRSAIEGAGSGLKSAASRAGETAKAHPVATTAIGTALTAGVVMLVMRAMRGGAGSGNDQEASGSADESSKVVEDVSEVQLEDHGDTLNRLRQIRGTQPASAKRRVTPTNRRRAAARGS